MIWLGLKDEMPPDERAREQQARMRLLEQERRMEALDRMVQVIRHDLLPERPEGE